MNITESFFVQGLCAFATGKDEKLNTEGVDRKELMSLAKRHSVAGILSYVINRSGLFEGEQIVEKLTTDYEKTLSVMLRRSLAADNLSRNFSNNNIAHIPFKGSTVAKYYPIPELRVYSDADMIVKAEDLESIDSMMIEKGFEKSLADEGVVTCYKKGIEYYELHTALNIPDDEAAVFSEIWENAEPYEGASYRFNESFHLCYLISHIEKHMRSGGAGIKMYLDIALFLKNSKGIDFSKVRERMKKCNLSAFFETVLHLCHRWFGTELPFETASMDDDLYEQLCSFTLGAGVYGDHTKEGALESDLARVGNGKCAKFRFLWRKVFPSSCELYRVYPEYEGKLMAAWFAHLFSFAKKDKRKNIKTVMKTDVKKAMSRRDFLIKLGCKE